MTQPGVANDLPSDVQRQALHWRRVRVVTAVLLLVWGVVTVGSIWFARDLDFLLLGWPFAYWAVAQGALWVYLLLIGLYAMAMSRLERAHAAASEPVDGH